MLDDLAQSISMVCDVSHTCCTDHPTGLGRRGLAFLSAVRGRVGGVVIAGAVIVGLALAYTNTPTVAYRTMGKGR